MRIRFVYNDPIHAWPLLQSIEAAAAIGVDLEPHEERSAQCFDRYFAGNWDAVLIHQELMSEQVVDCGRPVVISERIDGAQLGSSRRWISQAAGVLKGFRLRPAELNNQYRGRVLAHRLRAAGIRGPKSSCAVDGLPEPLAGEELGKIHAFYGFGAYRSRQPFLAAVPELAARRSTAVHFAGTVTYSGTEVETHRRMAVEVCRKIPRGVGHCGRYFDKIDRYIASLLASRCVLSPWGWGEACHRDYEAWALGAIVIKPDSDYVEGWPDVYRSGETYLSCRPDWADVPELVDRVKRDWKQLEPMRRRCRMLAEQAADPAAIAGRLKHVLEMLL